MIDENLKWRCENSLIKTQSQHHGLLLTSLLGFDLQDVRRWPVTYRGEAQHPEAVGDVRNQAWDGSQAAVVCVVLLPGAERCRHVWAVVDPVAPDLPVGLLGRFPLDQHCAGTQHACLDMQRWRGGGLFAGAGFHGVAGRPAANVVDGHDAELILRVGAKSTNAVTRGCNAFYFLEAIVWGLGSVLDHVIGDRFWVSRVPGESHTGGCGLSRDEGGGGLWQGWRGRSTVLTLISRLYS